MSRGSMDRLQSCSDEWIELEAEYIQLEEKHQEYLHKLDEMLTLQKACKADIAHHRYRTNKVMDTMNKTDGHATTEEKGQMNSLREMIQIRKQNFREMEESLPHKNGIYLSVILGQVPVSLLNKPDKFQYKQEYEQFKLAVTYIIMVFCVFLLFVDWYRWTDSILQFILVWYYCTLTIRENILIVNGSRIKGWWVTHHFIMTALAGILLIWPISTSYELFRTQFLYYCIYTSCIQVMQYYYQRGSLYRLRALGERHNMDITVEGFMSWMWKGLSFLMPILFTGYLFQAYNMYRLYQISRMDICHEWQVPVLSAMFLILVTGNVTTTLAVIRQKIRKEGVQLNFITNKYHFRNHGNAHKDT